MARYSESWLIESGRGPAYVEFVTIKKGEPRVLIPKPASNYISWLKGEEKLRAILELAEPGRIIGHSRAAFDLNADPFIQNQVDCLEAGEEKTVELARKRLLAIGERFQTVKIDAEHHISFNKRALNHLEHDHSSDHQMVFFALLDTFEFWSANFYLHAQPYLANDIKEICTSPIKDQ